MNPLGLSLESGQTVSLVLVLLRVTGFIVAAPLLGRRTVPGPVKAGLIVVLAFTLAPRAEVAPGAGHYLLAAPVELVTGLALGFALGLGFTAIESGARLLSIQMGLSLGAVFDPVGGEASTPFDPLFTALAALLFLAFDFHLAMLEVLAGSFQALPIGGGLPEGLLATVAQLAALSIQLGIRVALPLALVLLVAELAVALISRAIPQVNVFFLGLPLKVLLGIALVAAALPVIADGSVGIFRFLIDQTNGALAAAAAVVQ